MQTGCSRGKCRAHLAFQESIISCQKPSKSPPPDPPLTAFVNRLELKEQAPPQCGIRFEGNEKCTWPQLQKVSASRSFPSQVPKLLGPCTRLSSFCVRDLGYWMGIEWPTAEPRNRGGVNNLAMSLPPARTCKYFSSSILVTSVILTRFYELSYLQQFKE